MAVAEVKAPDGRTLEVVERRDARRAELTARALSSTEVGGEGGSIRVRWRYPVGATLWVEGGLVAAMTLTGWQLPPIAVAAAGLGAHLGGAE